MKSIGYRMTDLYKIIYLSVRLSVYISIYISSNHQSKYLSYVHLATHPIVSLCLPTMTPIAVEMVRMRARLVLQIHTAALTDAADKVDGCFAKHSSTLLHTRTCLHCEHQTSWWSIASAVVFGAVFSREIRSASVCSRFCHSLQVKTQACSCPAPHVSSTH